MAEFASKGVAGSGLGLGIAGTALGLLNSGFLGNNNNPALGGDINITAPDVEVARLRRGGVYASGGCGYGYGYGHGHAPFVNHYELNLTREIAAKDAIIADKDSKLFTVSAVQCAKDEIMKDLNSFKLETANRFCYDEKLIQDNKCEIEKTNINICDNYYKTCKVIRPWDICPPVAAASATAPAYPFQGGCNCGHKSTTIA